VLRPRRRRAPRLQTSSSTAVRTRASRRAPA
jgi:hypothetical protein